MLFVWNSVSVLTLIDVPVCFPLLLQTESTHTKVVITGSEEWDKKKTQQQKPFSAAFRRPFVSVSFPLFLRSEKRRQRRKSKVNRWKVNGKGRQGGRETEWMVGDSRHTERPFLQKGGSNSQFNHTIGNTLAERLQDGGDTALYWNVYQDVKPSTPPG